MMPAPDAYIPSHCFEPETDDPMAIEVVRGHLWDQAIVRFEAGERGVEAREAIEQVASRLDLEL